MKIDHIGIAVKDINKSLDFYLSLFPEAEYERVSYAPGRMDMVLIQAENVKVELLTPWDDESAFLRHGCCISRPPMTGRNRPSGKSSLIRRG